MAVDPKIVITAIQAAGSEKVRKIVMSVVFFTLGLILLIFVTFSSIVSGVFGVFSTSVLKNQWNIYRSTVSDVFSGFKSSSNADIQAEVYKFMPDFQFNLSKALISECLNDDELIIFDDEEISFSQARMKDRADALRKITSEKELTNFLLGSGIKLELAEIRQSEFLNDTGITNIGNYSKNIQEYLYIFAKHGVKKYKYIEEPTITNGVKYNYQALEVWGENGGLEQKVEFYTGGNIYLPELLAMYNTAINKNNLDSSTLDEQIAEVIGSIPETPDEYLAFLLNSLKYALTGDSKSNLNIVKTFSIKALIEQTGIGNIAQFDVNYPDPRTCTVTLGTIDTDTWRQIFGINEELIPFAEQAKAAIETALETASIPREEWYIPIADASQQPLEYFGGLLTLSMGENVNSTVSSIYGNLSPIHEYNGGDVLEKGLTLHLDQKSEINISLQQGCDKFITDAFVYDVWNMNERNVEKDSTLYNHSAVTVALVIDLQKFKNTYGFSFPKISGLDESSGFVTVFAEFSCLSETPLAYKNAGEPISRDYTNKLYIGTTHHGKVKESHDSGIYSHAETQSGVCSRHVSVKLNIRGGKTEKPKPESEMKEYKGVTTADMGVTVNPALYIKGLINYNAHNISAAMPK